MEISKNKTTVLTGIFVLAAMAILIVTILIVGKKNDSFTKSIVVKATFNDVNGLGKGNNVWFEGVKIGTVKDVVFAGKGVEVSFTIDDSALPHIYADSKAKLGSDGLIGNKIVVIYGGSSTTSTVKAGHIFRVEKAAGTEEIMNTLQASNKNLLVITENFKAISTDMASGKGNIGKLLKDETLINTLQATVIDLQKAGSNAETLTANLSAYSNKLKNKGSLANELVTDTTFFEALKSTALHLKKTTITASQIADNLKIATLALKDTSGPVGVLLNDRQAAANLKNTTFNLQSSTHKLDETMEALQHNFLVRGFFKKKERVAAKKDTSNAVTGLKK
jgi:phospholipid/cholesterol/gamma-HCH transport system substrate-binding protein